MRSQALLDRLEHFGVKLGLERIRRLLIELDSPQLATPTVLVAGTNGKGSTAALLASIARATGARVGGFASPHLESPLERIVLDGRAIDDDDLFARFEEILDVAQRSGAEAPTYFEAFTLAAFGAYRAANLDLAVMEVGLGGRLDATNASEPVLGLVTSIGFDHQKQLGSTLGAIAGEKAAICRAGRPLLGWGDEPEVAAAFERTTRAAGAALERLEQTVRLEPLEVSPRRQRLRLHTPVDRYDLVLDHLPGSHQQRNAALAVRAAEHLDAAGVLSIDRQAVIEGVAACRWPGRLEWVDLPDGRRVLLDVAHNADGAAAVAAFLGDLPEPPNLLFGAVGDKAIGTMLPTLAAVTDDIVLTRPRSSRATDPRAWLTLIDRPADVLDDADAALERALDRLAADRTLAICGSIYLVGALRRSLRQRFGVPSAP
ncbi:MAG: cyanophycin synthetase [Acidobacteriota bacterium]